MKSIEHIISYVMSTNRDSEDVKSHLYSFDVNT